MLRVHKLFHDAPDLMVALWEFLDEEPVPIEELEGSIKPKESELKEEPRYFLRKRKPKEEKDRSSQVSSSKVLSCR